MKKTFVSINVVIVGCIIAVIAVLAIRSVKVPIQINTKDIPEHGLIIVAQSHPEFASLRRSLQKGSLLAEQLPQPYVFIKNLNSKRVAAYSLKWELVKDDGQVVIKTRTYSRDDILEGKEAPEDKNDRIVIRPNKARLFSLYGYGDGEEALLNSTSGGENEQAGNDKMLQKLEQVGIVTRANDELSHTISVSVSIDGAFFEDGTFVGPNTTSFFERVKAKYGTKHDVLQTILKRWKGGATPADVMKYLEDRAAALKGYEIAPSFDATPDEISKFYEKDFLDQILRIRTLGGNDDQNLRRLIHYNKPDRHLSLRKLDNSS